MKQDLDDFSDYIEVPSRHTDEMISREMEGMLGLSKVRLCLGHLMMLAHRRSPYVYGGQVGPEELAYAMELLGSGGMDPVGFHAELLSELDAAFRPLELFEEDRKDDKDAKRSVIDAFSPEWLADVVRCACEAMPSITMEQALWTVPVVMMMHLGVSTARKNGAVTQRPVDMKEAMRIMRERRKQKRQQNQKQNKEN